jgi:hypothetical protein
MSGHQDKPTTAQERADRSTDDKVEAGVEETFPASDPVANTGSQGARAVPPEELMRGREAKPQGGAASLTARFESMEAAKLAVEALVRDGPVDRRSAEVEAAGQGATVRIAVPPADEGRLGEMLRRQPGQSG